jgi:hypothetical protein
MQVAGERGHREEQHAEVHDHEHAREREGDDADPLAASGTRGAFAGVCGRIHEGLLCGWHDAGNAPV